MKTVIYTGRAHRLQVGDVLVERGVPTEVTNDICKAISGRPDVRVCGPPLQAEPSSDEPGTESNDGGEE